MPLPGEIVHARETFAEPAGGGAVAAAQLAALAGEATLFTALSADELGQRSRARLPELGIRLHASTLDEPQRRGFTYLDDAGERTITDPRPAPRPRGDDALPGSELAERTPSTSSAATSPRSARRARRACSSRRRARSPTLQEAGVEVDALVGSAQRPGRALRGRRPRSGAALRDPHRGRRGRDDRARRRPLGARAAPRPGRRRVRVRRLLRRRRHVRARRRTRASRAPSSWAPAAAPLPSRGTARSASSSVTERRRQAPQRPPRPARLRPLRRGGRRLELVPHLRQPLEPARQVPVAWPRSVIADGSSTPRTIVASTKIATASADAELLERERASVAKMENTATMTTAALVTTPAVALIAVRDRLVASACPRSDASRMRLRMNTW